MLYLWTHIRARASDDEGQGGVEYLGVVIAAALLVLVIVGAAEGFGGDIVDGIRDKVQEILDAG